MSDPLRERLQALIVKWRTEKHGLGDAADEVEAALRAVPAGKWPERLSLGPNSGKLDAAYVDGWNECLNAAARAAAPEGK